MTVNRQRPTGSCRRPRAAMDETEYGAPAPAPTPPGSRRTTPADVAEAAVMLAGGDLASGETLFVDSGQHLLSQPRDVIYLEREGAR